MKKTIALTAAMLLLIALCACAPANVKNLKYQYTYQGANYTGVYNGTASKKIPTGTGTFTSDDGTLTYTGAWTDGKMSGTGKLTDSKYVIKFSYAERTGKYEGDTVNGIAEGSGVFTAQNTENITYTYTGSFKSGTFNGQGTCEFETEPKTCQIGTYTNGDFTPTAKEYFSCFGKLDPSAPFGIKGQAEQFLTNHENIFTASTADGLDALVDTGLAPEAYKKSPDKYGDKLMHVTNLNVIQISEEKLGNYPSVTFILAADADYSNYYYISYLGSVDAYEGNKISAYLLPLDYFTYETTGGDKNWAIAAAAAYVTK